MKILNKPRQTGKSTDLIKLSSKHGLYIICATRDRAQYLSTMAMEMGIHIPFPITPRELPLRSPYIKGVLIDDFEDVLSYLIGKPIVLATTSKKVIGDVNELEF